MKPKVASSRSDVSCWIFSKLLLLLRIIVQTKKITISLSHRSNYHYKHQSLSLNSCRISWAPFFFRSGFRVFVAMMVLWLYFRCNWWNFWNFLLFCRLACKEIHIGGSRSKRLVSNSATIRQSLLNSSLLHTSPNDLFFFVAFTKLFFSFLSPRSFSLVMRMMMLIHHTQLLEYNN